MIIFWRPSICTGESSADLVRHFLIESSAKGVRVKGSSQEPYFGEQRPTTTTPLLDIEFNFLWMHRLLNMGNTPWLAWVSRVGPVEKRVALYSAWVHRACLHTHRLSRFIVALLLTTEVYLYYCDKLSVLAP